MILQKHEKRYAIATFCQTARATMACDATIGKQPCGRFTFIEILGKGVSADEHIDGPEGEQTALL